MCQVAESKTSDVWRIDIIFDPAVANLLLYQLFYHWFLLVREDNVNDVTFMNLLLRGVIRDKNSFDNAYLLLLWTTRNYTVILLLIKKNAIYIIKSSEDF